MGYKQKGQFTHEGQTHDVEIEIMSAQEAGIEITDELRARIEQAKQQMRTAEDQWIGKRLSRGDRIGPPPGDHQPPPH